MTKIIPAAEAKEHYKKHIEETVGHYIEFVTMEVNKAVQQGRSFVMLECQHPNEVKDSAIEFLKENGYDVSEKGEFLSI